MTTHLPAAPVIVERAAQPYVAIRGTVGMDRIPEIADRMPEVFIWLGERGIEPAGPPFFKYNLIDMARQLEIEVGVPVASSVDGDGTVLSGVLPAGRYATVTHVGHPAELVATTAALLEWAEKQGLTWDVSESPAGERWAARLESYHTDPAEEPDMNKWEIELAFRLAA
jgi:effector-binding domain-containing protein